jgi:hypothetical protein
MTIEINQLIRAPACTTQWLKNLLDPVALACRFEKSAPAVHLAPRRGPNGALGGSFSKIEYWNNCVHIGVLGLFTSSRGIRALYLHEISHLLVFGIEFKRGEKFSNHGPIFLLTYLTLLHRSAQYIQGFQHNAVDCISLYDFSNRPFDLPVDFSEHDWRALVLSFGLRHYKTLSADDALPAELIPARALDLWHAGLAAKQQEEQAVEHKKQREAAEKSQLSIKCESQEREIQRLKKEREISRAWRLLFLKDWMPTVVVGGFFSVAVFSVGYGLGLARALP